MRYKEFISNFLVHHYSLTLAMIKRVNLSFYSSSVILSVITVYSVFSTHHFVYMMDSFQLIWLGIFQMRERCLATRWPRAFTSNSFDGEQTLTLLIYGFIHCHNNFFCRTTCIVDVLYLTPDPIAYIYREESDTDS